jgi:hypothetical protein
MNDRVSLIFVVALLAFGGFGFWLGVSQPDSGISHQEQRHDLIKLTKRLCGKTSEHADEFESCLYVGIRAFRRLAPPE